MDFRERPSGSFRSKTRAERFGAAGQHHDRGLTVVLKTARGVGELAHRLRRHRIDAVAAVETHDRYAAIRPETLLDFHKLGQCFASLPVIFANSSAEINSADQVSFTGSHSSCSRKPHPHRMERIEQGAFYVWDRHIAG
jgi:hypothetical protein